MNTTDIVFAGQTATSPLGDLQAAAIRAALRAAASDLAEEPEILASDAATVAMLLDAREPLEAWLGAYAPDEALLQALSDADCAEVLGSAWLAYSATVMQRRDAAREASKTAAS